MKILKLSLIKIRQIVKLLHQTYSSFSRRMFPTTIVFLILMLFISGCKKNQTTKPVVIIPPPTNIIKDFTIAVLPDIQNYMSGYFGGKEAMFTSQIEWIRNNKKDQNIVYVIGLGDITEHGDDVPVEWVKAKNGFYALETDSIPYGLAIGNHDQKPFGGHILSVTTNQYNQYFGVSHFAGRTYYGGHYGSNNNSHYDLFTAGSKDFIVIYIEYDEFNEENVNLNNWADDLLVTYATRKAIVVSHYLIGIGEPASFGTQGLSIYNRLKSRPNVFMFLCGHIYGADNSGEGYCEDTYNGNTIRTYLSDYQQRQEGGVNKGGNGYMRLMKFSVYKNDVTIKTFSPYVNQYETDSNSQFIKPLFSSTQM